jgi:hypothetical protein
MNTLKKLGINTQPTGLVGKKIDMEDVFDKDIILHAYEIRDSKYPRKPGEKCIWMQIELEEKKRVCFTTSVVLMKTLEQVDREQFPIQTRIIKNNSNRSFEFTEPQNNN